MSESTQDMIARIQKENVKLRLRIQRIQASRTRLQAKVNRLEIDIQNYIDKYLSVSVPRPKLDISNVSWGAQMGILGDER